MEWIDGIQRALDYIEENITEEIDCNDLAKISYSLPYHFQRVFSILCGYTLGEYIRNRRLTLAGQELAKNKSKVIDVAVKYGYNSPDSFTKAFTKFHGITPSEAHKDGAQLHSFARLSIKITLEGGNIMNYRIEKKPAIKITGLKTEFKGTPDERYGQQHDFMVKGETRFVRYAMQGIAKTCETEYSVVSNVRDDGFDFIVGNIISDSYTKDLSKHIGSENANILTVMEIPEQKYLVVETERNALSILSHLDLRYQAVSQCFAKSNLILANSPEITVYHAFENDKDSSYIELWLPIKENAE